MIRMISLCILILVLGIWEAEAVDHPHTTFLDNYTYNLKDLERGPTAWGGECTRGSHQSPIDIRYRDHGVGWGYTKIWFSKLYQQNQKGFYFTNVGHSFQVQLSGSIREPNSEIALSGAGLQDRYTFAQLHFHWGDRNEVGSEHTLSGRRYPMEIHIVHFKTKYGNLSQALSQNSKDSNAVTVLAILCELGPENSALRPIVDAAKLKTIQNPSDRLMFSHKSLNLHKLMPKHLDFVRYKGSLTTPPCTEKVAWTVFLCPISVSMEQLETFRRLRDRDGNEYYNYRPLQKVNERKLKYYKVPDPISSSTLSDQDGGSGSATTLITKTIQNTLQEVNSLFANIINVLYESQLYDREEIVKHGDDNSINSDLKTKVKKRSH